MLEVRMTPTMGRGVFATRPIARGTCLVVCQGMLVPSAAIDNTRPAMQVGPDLWLCSAGDNLDDCINHSCEPNAGFLTGEPALFALRDIGAGEQITWDYSTSIGEVGWTLECECGAPSCRGIVRSWWELSDTDRERMRHAALLYLREG
jgi:hypothetical protein